MHQPLPGDADCREHLGICGERCDAHGVFDIPLLSNIPNLVYLAPTNKQEYLAMLDWGIGQDAHPVAICAPRNGVFHADGEVDTDYSGLDRYKVVMLKAKSLEK